jgi:hypothetical protein
MSRYANFDDFLANLLQRKRNSIRKERRKVTKQGVELVRLTGDAIQPHHWVRQLYGQGATKDYVVQLQRAQLPFLFIDSFCAAAFHERVVPDISMPLWRCFVFERCIPRVRKHALT